MRAIIDTCVIIDALQDRAPFGADAQRVFLAVANRRVEGLVTAKTVTDIYYLMQRYTHDGAQSRRALSALFALFDVLDTAGMDCRRAISSEMSDYEDAVMVESAVRAEADCIVTRNKRDYERSSVPVYAPAELLQLIQPEDDRPENA